MSLKRLIFQPSKVIDSWNHLNMELEICTVEEKKKIIISIWKVKNCRWLMSEPPADVWDATANDIMNNF